MDEQQRQYEIVKYMYPDMICFMRQGDLLIAYGEDARKVSGILEQPTSTKGKDEIFMVEFDTCYKAIEPILEAGEKVCIIEQVSQVQGDVQPQRVTAPGALFESEVE